jgi:hypothetical protein
MLTIKQNLLEVINGGQPDRFVNQYEFMDLIMEAPMDLPLAPAKDRLVHSPCTTMTIK